MEAKAGAVEVDSPKPIRRMSNRPEDEVFKGQMKSAKYNPKVSVTGSLLSRHCHTAVNYEDFMFIYAGLATNERALSDLGCFHYATRSWSTIENESSQKLAANTRYGHSVALHGDSMFIFGGTSERALPMEDLLEFKFETQSWSTVYGEGNKPYPRHGHTAIVYENSMYIIGGLGSFDLPYNDVYELNLDTFKWSKVEATGNFPGRFNHTAVVFKDSIYVFGGSSGMGLLGDFWEFKIKTKTWIQINLAPAPTPREGHSAVLLQNSMYICGGNPDYMDIFEFDFDYRKWYKVQLIAEQSIPARQFFTAVVRGDCIFFVGDKKPENGSDLDYICIGRDDFEEEFELDEISKMQNVPKSSWEAVAMRRHPDILELKERIRPLSKGSGYSKHLFVGKTEAKCSLPYQTVLQLVMEHLAKEGFSKVVQTIESESGVKYQNRESEESRLITLLRTARRRIHKDLLSSDVAIPENDEIDPEVQVIDQARRMDEKEDQDVNIWNESNESRRNIIKSKDDDKVLIKAATLNKLVQYLTSEKDKIHDVNFMRTFLYTYQSFTSPEMLLKKLIQRYHVPIPKGAADDKFKTEVQQPIRNRVCNVMKFWIDKCVWDFNEKLINLLNGFIDGPLSRDGNLGLVKQLRNSINKLQKRKNAQDEDKPFVFGVPPPEPKVPRNIFSTTLSLNSIDEIEVARQLTLIDFNIFSNISPPELLSRSWCNPDLKHKAPHVLEMLNRVDEISNWVVSTILTHDLVNKKARARVIERFIKIAEHLKNLKNFQALYAVLSGLNNPLITRLHQTLADLVPRGPGSRESLNELSMIMSKENNFLNYREVLRFAATPCIPYLDAMLADIIAIEDSNPDLVSGLINFHKRQLLFKEITTLQGYQQFPYNLQPVHQIATFLGRFPKKSEDDLKDLSNKCEPAK